MAVTRKPLAYFKTFNSKGPVITPYFSTVDLVEMRKHPDYTECDAEGNDVEPPKAADAETTPFVPRREPAPAPAPKAKGKTKVTV